MARKPALVLALLLAVTAAPAAADLHQRKASIDARISALRTKVAAAQARETVLRGQIDTVTTQIRALEAKVGDVSLRYQSLARDLYLHQVRLSRLQELYRLQGERLAWLREQYGASRDRLDRRLISLYESDTPGTLDIVLSAHSFSEILDQIDYLRQLAREDEEIAHEVQQARVDVALARARTANARDGVKTALRTVQARTAEVRSVRDELVRNRDALAQQRTKKLESLSGLTEAERAAVGEIDALQAVSSQVADQIRAAQAANAARQAAQQPPAEPGSPAPAPAPAPVPPSTPSSSGLIWPVSGPITSPFGWRWGRMHEGIDIGVGYGTPIHAAAAGTVIYCGWEEGYGNFVVIDHGGGLATAYGHQSQIAVSCGEQVSQGQVIGYVGCTGHCFGPHLHFEVRINGEARDPLGYL